MELEKILKKYSFCSKIWRLCDMIGQTCFIKVLKRLFLYEGMEKENTNEKEIQFRVNSFIQRFAVTCCTMVLHEFE